MPITKTPARWQAADAALRAVQVAFDVEERVMQAIRTAAFHNNLSNSDQIRSVLGLSVAPSVKRPRLTVSLSPADYESLATRYGLSVEDKLQIKERVTQALIAFSPVVDNLRANDQAAPLPQPTASELSHTARPKKTPISEGQEV
jgi:hypothetical protein